MPSVLLALSCMLHSHSASTVADLEVSEIDDLVKSKFQYVVSCQVYGQQKRELDPKATDIDFLLARHPNLRVAYIDNRKARTASGATKDEFYSVLIKSVPVGDV